MVHHGLNLEIEPTQKNLGCDFNFLWVGFHFRVFKVAKKKLLLANLLRLFTLLTYACPRCK
jgi:hypothetical protein